MLLVYVETLEFWEDFQTNQATTNILALATAWYRVTHVPTQE